MSTMPWAKSRICSIKPTYATSCATQPVWVEKAAPRKLSMNKEERQQVLRQVQDLGAVKTLSEDEAKKRLDVLLDVLKEHKDILVAADFPWPGSARLANPFVEDESRAHLNALRARLEK